MKLLKDLIIQRKELQDWDNAITWSRNGTLYFRTSPEITIGEPRYQDSSLINNNAKGLFYTKEYPLVVGNVMEFETATDNAFLNTQPASFVRTCKPSKVNDSEYLAVLSNNFNVIIYKDKNPVAKIDQSGVNVQQRCFHAFEWSPYDNTIVVGNEAGELLFFQKEPESDNFGLINRVKMDELQSQYITDILWIGNNIVVTASDNSVWKLEYNKNLLHAKKIIDSSRFKIFDLAIINDRYVIVTSSGHLYIFNLTSNKLDIERLPVANNFYIVPIRKTDTLILVSNANNMTIKLDLDTNEISLQPDTLIGPHLLHKFKKWNDIWNESGKYETNLNIYGVTLSPDGFTVAILYNVNRVTWKYLISSQRQYHVMFVPLCEQWEISNEATGLAWYQTHIIYQRGSLPLNGELSNENSLKLLESNPKFNTQIDFKQYLINYFDNENLNQLRFNIYLDNTDKRCINIFRALIIKYALSRLETITDVLDIACLTALLKATGSPPNPDIPSDKFEEYDMKGEFITQTFSLKITDDNSNSSFEEITSKEGNTWKLCAITLLPILGLAVKRCPVTNKRVIDIEADSLNHYGWFTRTLLEVCCKNSVYTGTGMI
ncbi:similar to Saccharomyces cerevisiae YPL007C TFC8 One of six subunits of RNA polymerase III transcription initiation factor complex (TFIIIC) [Maudiozyma barnettii]|uniref:Similar to Saccharomyces cerevisiae YPL007C TFC8 One of six subunits of RNA polymerase III transcription initiation factor complex (TFIIIC) n=1 Tax=Maudiozyma barnettii TaxID=61262 RepID=A0A8H2ZH51_9SACH|nr:transcription factor TFIIIC subunit TFC8 [Kazachstania barnettii]CAB4254393.1 similar to Saccharomyces cerevisiae YPL007C TFC8 One of six subunits of RNA polymerase III transcription initiation factor complex (TFIIIC) [Kazachstania barnettii]CAD1782297.1 similar to Saccharomyces cerevisiae YPL007C TFC8 One of six subunits of RNA polymerase III transcription initiation factor complex (TFIIIC) [Kazachstania barnettii]